MPVLVPFEKCIARPNEGQRVFPLRQHLVQVKAFMEKWIESRPALKEQNWLVRMMGLAGACHDIAKSNAAWQAYIQGKTQENGPPHASAGAFLFSYLGYHWLQAGGAWQTHKKFWIWIVRDIADHHGALKMTKDDHWIKLGYQNWSQEVYDWEGVRRFYMELYPELNSVDFSPAGLKQWALNVRKYVQEAGRELQRSNSLVQHSGAMEDLQIWRCLTTGLIAGDRFDIAETATSWLDEAKWREGQAHIDAYCQSNGDHPLSAVRANARRQIMDQLAANPNQRFYTLEMPTGYGKTITALSMASWLGCSQGYRKLIYVAPYLSILEQTAEVVKQAMNAQALEHHSLAVWDDQEYNPNQKEEKHEQRTPKSQLTMEAWAHDIICTSFQQFSKALFPKRAQDVLRRAFLQDSIILIDEPQIFKPEGWNTFLCGLETVANQFNLRVVFLSATMPTFKYGLNRQPAALSVKGDPGIERYQIFNRKEKMDEKKLAEFILQRPEVLQGVILNTIEDAYLVREALRERTPEAEVMIVHGMMVSLHKKMMIRKIQHHLKYRRAIPLIVISTQVLEAGVDVSFQHLARALPILPSIIQAAGRINRHLEDRKKAGEMSIFPFFRKGEKNTRKSIYAKPLMEITDQLFGAKEHWMESEMDGLIKTYYEEMFLQNTYTTSHEAIMGAHRGNWPELSQFEPFGADFFRLPLFIPWTYGETDVQFLPKTYTKLSGKYSFSKPENLYDCYRDRVFWKQRDFNERKQFMILFNHYVLNVPVKYAIKLAPKEDYLLEHIPILKDTDSYDADCGLISQFNQLENII